MPLAKLHLHPLLESFEVEADAMRGRAPCKGEGPRTLVEPVRAQACERGRFFRRQEPRRRVMCRFLTELGSGVGKDRRREREQRPRVVGRTPELSDESLQFVFSDGHETSSGASGVEIVDPQHMRNLVRTLLPLAT